ncbi:hypothetical protein [Pseudolysinimonas sp.]|uniref:hypothetical protein n=1 Tax=Pseudolysinimonas sp. TaxID=2680009 RepID=UPI00286C9E3A|nr:hypothetical protein [Pseudolysinimonas sp.]
MTMGFRVEITVEGLGMSAQVVEERFDSIANALYECQGIADQDLSADTSKARYTFTFDVLDIEDPVKAVEFAVSIVRTALHAAGGATPNWEQGFELIRQSSERARQRKKALV